mmetsp:Transcript_28392/g.81615  ORF Transcript_28392/g.81615 Transcript_28392/m.81615 type:complete len:287 (+) Transcript_28392:606-1466(+)
MRRPPAACCGWGPRATFGGLCFFPPSAIGPGMLPAENLLCRPGPARNQPPPELSMAASSPDRRPPVERFERRDPGDPPRFSWRGCRGAGESFRDDGDVLRESGDWLPPGDLDDVEPMAASPVPFRFPLVLAKPPSRPPVEFMAESLPLRFPPVLPKPPSIVDSNFPETSMSLPSFCSARCFARSRFFAASRFFNHFLTSGSSLCGPLGFVNASCIFSERASRITASMHSETASCSTSDKIPTVPGMGTPVNTSMPEYLSSKSDKVSTWCFRLSSTEKSACGSQSGV